MQHLTPETLGARIIAFLRDEMGIEDDLTVDTPLVSSGLVDSVGLMRLATFVERETGVIVPDQDVNVGHFDTVRQIVAYLGNRAA